MFRAIGSKVNFPELKEATLSCRGLLPISQRPCWTHQERSARDITRALRHDSRLTLQPHGRAKAFMQAGCQAQRLEF